MSALVCLTGIYGLQNSQAPLRAVLLQRGPFSFVTVATSLTRINVRNTRDSRGLMCNYQYKPNTWTHACGVAPSQPEYFTFFKSRRLRKPVERSLDGICPVQYSSDRFTNWPIGGLFGNPISGDGNVLPVVMVSKKGLKTIRVCSRHENWGRYCAQDRQGTARWPTGRRTSDGRRRGRKPCR